MKKIYPLLLSLILFFLTNASYAQCAFSNICNEAVEINLLESFNALEECDPTQNSPFGLQGSVLSCNNDGKLTTLSDSKCLEENWKVVWFKFNTGDYKFTDIRVNSATMGGIQSFGIDVFEDCGSGSILNFPLSPCDRVDKNKDFASVIMLELAQNTDYFIAVGSSVFNTGSFSIEVTTYDLESSENDDCFSQDIQIIPSALPPYSAGQIIDFTVSIPTLDLNPQVLWLQSIIPDFGTGWDPGSFNSGSGEPVTQSLPNANWNWFAEEEIYYKLNSPVYRTYTDINGKLALCRGKDCPKNAGTCLSEGAWFPAGWFAYQEAGGPECIAGSGNPNFGWGDGMGPWEMTFSLQVRALTAEEYLQGENNDLSIEIHLFTDAEIGCWNPQVVPFNGCINNKQGKFIGYIDCPNKPVIDAGDNIVLPCDHTSTVEFAGSGPSGPNYSILWTSAAGEIIGDSTTYDIEVSGAGTYIMAVTDNSSGCVSVDEVLVSYESQELEIFTVDNTCFGDEEGAAELVLEPGGSETIVWSTGETSVGISGLGSGVYGVTVTNENCISTGEAEIFEAEAIMINFDISYPSGTGLEDGSVEVDISGGLMPYNILWDNGETGEIRDNLGMGSYALTVTDASGCERTAQVVLINEECGFGAKLVETPGNLCFGENEAAISVEAYGDRELLKYNWSNGARGYTIRKLYAGEYSVTISNSENCSINLSHRVNEPEAIEIQLSPIPESSAGAEDGSILSNVMGGVAPYSYLWSNGATSEDLINVRAGWYSVEITDSNNCTVYQEVEIQDPPSIVSIFPNPTDRFVNIRGVRSNEIEFYTIYNLWGAEVNLTNTIAEDLIIDIEHLNPGIYYLVIDLINGSRHTFRLIKNY